MKKMLVTGGAGFIGSHFLKYMTKKYIDYHFINIDKLTYASNLSFLNEISHLNNYRFLQGDICDSQLIDSLFSEGIDYVVNFAAESHVDRSIQNPDIFVRTNVLGTNTLLNAAKKYGVEKYLQVSTDEVYGSLDLNDKSFFTEETPLAPNSPYSASKASADLLVRSYFKTYQVPVNITRCSNNYGPNQHAEKLIPTIIRKALKNESIPIYGDGLNIRDWLYVEDHCIAIDIVLHNGSSGEIYNIGGNNENTNLSLTKKLLSILNKPEQLIEFVRDRPGHDRRYAIDNMKIMKDLGWEPEFSFEEGFQKTVDWYINSY